MARQPEQGCVLMDVTRRGVLIGALAGGGLALGYVLRPRTYPLPLEGGADDTSFDAWIRIGGDGMVTVAVPDLEMGQGVTTLIPQIVAKELGADWRMVAVEPAPPSPLYANLPLAARWADMWLPTMPGLAADPDSMLARRLAENEGFVVAADGMSVAAYEASARAAAATVRALLCMAAADRWDVRWEECEAQQGVVLHGKHRLGFGELAQEAAGFDPPSVPPLRAGAMAEDPARFPPGGKLDYPRLDLPAKANGSWNFAGDVRLPGMVFAAIRHGPIGDSTLGSFDPKAAKGLPGMLGLVKGKRWLAAVAQDWWTAERALADIKPGFRTASAADSGRIEEVLDKALRTGIAEVFLDAGDPDEFLSSDFSLARRYGVAPALHAQLETASATARFTDGKLELWLACQAPEAARRGVADALGMSRRAVVIYPMPAGGSFDRLLEYDHAIEAALIARETGKPVQLIWSRWQEHVAGKPRTPVSAVMAARTSPQGDLIGWKARLALPATAREFGARTFGGKSARGALAQGSGADMLAMEGTVPPYAIEHMRIEQVPAAINLPTGRLRGNAHGYGAFFTECFIDELARKAKREPLGYRMALLGNDVRLAACLQRVAALAQWGGGADSSGQGLACHRIERMGRTGRIAVIVTARRDESGVKVDRISAVADLGRVINADIARQQIEGGLIFGMGLALGCSTAYAQGLPMTGRLGALGLPLLADCPEIEVEFMSGDADPADPGELGVVAVAPAIANALYSATGLRFRRLPLLAEEL